MRKNVKIIFKPKKFIIVFLTLILFLGFFSTSARAQWADHLVISAVQITEGEGKTNHDFIEIYNPTLNDINLKGYRLVKRTKIGTSDTSIKSWTGDLIIKAHGWRLWASSDDEAYSLLIEADDATKQTIAPDNGIAIRLGALDTGEIIDSAAWGLAENIFKEGNVSLNPGVGESLVRKPDNGNGNGEDTNNNFNDFIVITNFIPRNSQSMAAPAVENLEAPNLTPSPSPTPTPSPISDSGSSTAASVPSVQKSLPVAEAGQDKEAVVGENIYFDGSDSFDPQGKELVLSWDFGDKTTAKGVTVSHIYNATGEYKVILKADNGENISEDSLKIKIIAPEFSDKIILSEILPNPTGADKDGEWIELFNSGDKKVNLCGWILASSAKSGGKQYVFSSDNFIGAKSYLAVKRSESNLVLTNESGGVRLLWPPDKILSEVTYGAAKEGKSYAFINNLWQWSDAPTPGKENLAQPLAADLKAEGSFVSSVKTIEDMTDEEVFYDENYEVGDILFEPFLIKNAVSRSMESLSFEDYLNGLISEQINSMVLGVKASGEELQDEILLSADDAGRNGVADITEESACEDFCLDSAGGSKDVRNNPWFWGDIALSALSLFLVWRYQEVRKKLK